jgi:hypothetical protein
MLALESGAATAAEGHAAAVAVSSTTPVVAASRRGDEDMRVLLEA